MSRGRRPNDKQRCRPTNRLDFGNHSVEHRDDEQTAATDQGMQTKDGYLSMGQVSRAWPHSGRWCVQPRHG
jgi:hypothetical protein